MKVKKSIKFAIVASMMYGMCCFAQTPDHLGQIACTSGNLHEERPRTIAKVTSFVDELIQAVGSDDKRRVARMMSYPLSVAWPSGREKRIRSEAGFIADYQQIITPRMKALIIKQSSRCVSRVGAQGFTISSGELWFDEFPDGQIKIFSINSVVMPDE